MVSQRDSAWEGMRQWIDDQATDAIDKGHYGVALTVVTFDDEAQRRIEATVVNKVPSGQVLIDWRRPRFFQECL